MKDLVFLVQGSQPDPYRVVFRKEGDNLTALCSCATADADTLCKHRLSILLGKTTGIVSANTGDVQTVLGWLVGSDVKKALQRLAEAGRALEDAQEEYNAARDRLLKAMRD